MGVNADDLIKRVPRNPVKNYRGERGRAKVSRKCKRRREGRGETIDEGLKRKASQGGDVDDDGEADEERGRGRDEGRPAVSSNKVEVRAASDDD